MATRFPSLSVVIPVYNSAEMLHELVQRLAAALDAHVQEYEVILVNDGSRDASWNTIRALTRERPWLRGICLARNYGQQNALMAGIRHARHAWLMTMDDDLQHPPEAIPDLLAAAVDNQWDAIYAPPVREQHGWWRDACSKGTKWLIGRTMGLEYANIISAWRLFRTGLRDAFAEYRSPDVSIDVLIGWATDRITFVRMEHHPRRSGASQYNFFKLLRITFNLVTSFSTAPLRFASVLGFIFTLLGGLVLCYAVGNYLVYGSAVPGFAFLASIVAIFSGVQLFVLGLIGEYLSRLHLRSMGKPIALIRETCN